MLYNDLRSWMSKVEEFGELKTVEGIDWKYEMGAVTEVYARNPPYSAILFDKIKDYPAGHRVLVGVHHQSLKRQCLTTHLPLDYDRYQFIQAWRKRLNNPTYIPPRVIETGPVLENVYEGKDIDLYSLPCPIGTKKTADATSAPLMSSSRVIWTKAGSTSAVIALWCTTKTRWRSISHRANKAGSFGKNILTKAALVLWRSASAMIRCCSLRQRNSLPGENRNMTTPAASAAKPSM